MPRSCDCFLTCAVFVASLGALSFHSHVVSAREVIWNSCTEPERYGPGEASAMGKEPLTQHSVTSLGSPRAGLDEDAPPQVLAPCPSHPKRRPKAEIGGRTSDMQGPESNLRASSMAIAGGTEGPGSIEEAAELRPARRLHSQDRPRGAKLGRELGRKMGYVPLARNPRHNVATLPRKRPLPTNSREAIRASWPVPPVRDVPMGSGNGTCVVLLGALTQADVAAPYNQGPLAELWALGPAKLFFVGGRLQMRKIVPSMGDSYPVPHGFEKQGNYMVRSLTQAQMARLAQLGMQGAQLGSLEVIEESEYHRLWEEVFEPRLRSCTRKMEARGAPFQAESPNRFTATKASHSISTLAKAMAGETCQHVVVFRPDLRFPPPLNITRWLLSDPTALFSMGGAAGQLSGIRSDLFFGSREVISRLDGLGDFIWTSGCPVDPDLRFCSHGGPCMTKDMSLSFEAQFGQYVRQRGITVTQVPSGAGQVIRYRR